MKKPKTINRYCKVCKKHTPHKVGESKKRGRNAARPMSYGSTPRVKARGQRRGTGNHGRFSKPPKPKMTGKKLSKKTDFRYLCSVCKKSSVQRVGTRAKKIELI
ncbi:MAG: 50S ribosomal protein L44e [Nanoarchaeota archaeon]